MEAALLPVVLYLNSSALNPILGAGIITVFVRLKMKRRHKVELWVGMVAAGTALFFLLPLTSKEHPTALTGVVIRQDADPRKQVPLAGVEITADDALAMRDSQSDSTGFFRLLLLPALKP